MSKPAIELAGLVPAAESVTLTEGEDGLAFLCATAEPVSVGAPPFVPSLVQRVDLEWPQRRVLSAAGIAVTAPLEPCGRGTLDVEWRGLTPAQRDTLRAWIDGTLFGTRFAYDLRVDGPEDDAIAVRAVATPTDEWASLGAWTVRMTCEEVG